MTVEETAQLEKIGKCAASILREINKTAEDNPDTAIQVLVMAAAAVIADTGGCEFAAVFNIQHAIVHTVRSMRKAIESDDLLGELHSLSRAPVKGHG